MSETTLSSLLEYLYGTLTPSNMRWLAEHLVKYADAEENEALKPHTMEEINAMLDAAEADIAAGRTIPHEEMMRKWEEELALEEKREMQMAEAV